MQKNLVSLSVEKEKRSYQLLIATDAPLGEIHDVLIEMKSYVISLMQPQQQEQTKIDKVEYIENA